MFKIFSFSGRRLNRNLYMVFTLFLLAVLIFAGACAHSPAGKAYDVLYTAAITYDTAMNFAGDEYRAGNITEDQKDRIVKLAHKYRLAVKTGQQALEVYKAAELRGDKADINKAQRTLDIAIDAVGAAREVLTMYIQATSKGGA